MNLLNKYFIDLTPEQIQKFDSMYSLYDEWNRKINLISRRDFDFFYERHVLHSLSIAAFVKFPQRSLVLDAGTGGGFPGIPLAVAFPEVTFHLVDSVSKKIKAVETIAKQLNLSNVVTHCRRIETLQDRYNYVVSRAVAPLERMVQLTSHLLLHDRSLEPCPGIFYLKGGDIHRELTQLDWNYRIYDLKELFSEPFFETKMLIHLYK